ncbi:MAG: tetratricopeptide repeat protein [Verrucomicrobia bacterium]|nr:tetratricopeptide repeat protein [Verrucomicrobiota bacterium]
MNPHARRQRRGPLVLRSRRACPVIALVLFTTTALAADPSARIREAAQPLDEGVPEVAASQLQALLPNLSGANLATAKERLGEALIAAQRPAEALRIADSLPQSSEARFLRAEALAKLDRFEDALASYREVAADNSAPQRTLAAFQSAEMLRGLNRTDEALAAYRVVANDARVGNAARLREAELLISKGDAFGAKRLLDHAQPKGTVEKRQKRFLRARVEMLEHRPDKAISLLEPLVKKPEGTTHETCIAALFAIADAHLEINAPESGDDYLEDYIDRHPNDPELERVFAKLDEIYRHERKPNRGELERWIQDPAQPRRGFARWYLAQLDWRTGRQAEALRQFEALRTAAVNSPALAPALLQYARIEINRGRFNSALDILTAAEKAAPRAEIAAQINFEAGRAMYGARRFEEAAARFTRVKTTRLANDAILNASLAWLQAGNTTQVQAGASALAVSGDKDAQADLALEQALTAASKGEKNAATLLQDFVRQFPTSQRVAEAHLALAELAFHAAPPKLEQSDKGLAMARDAHPSPAVIERSAYLAIWLADARGSDSDAVIRSASEFLHEYPQSSLAGEVRMKLAETHFRRQDFANAQTQFEILAQENPQSPLAEKALFLAGQSAEASMTSHSLERALELLTQVVKMDGDLRWTARNEQAAIERRLRKPQDAQVLYDEVLKGDAPVAAKDEALCGKADILVEQAKADSADLARAVALYDQLANEAAANADWRNQALFKKALCLERQTDRAGALATFYRVLDTDMAPGKQPEFFWYYKAGFNAARLLEEDQKWNSAASVYEKLAAANGPRSDEAKTRLSQLRLEHFLWQD